MHLASIFINCTFNLMAGVLHWLKHSGELKYRYLYLFLNPETSSLRKKCCHLV
ncbi:hypothetical protein D8674_021799 [Pyrus ussuriensis x Pyrus communis]|uniref:Uncharacterized protein n=1 Tax=Pyrus ussuriensis x Pyrus communis TaxID=2448454 RepID=A0A5N5GMW6_9ROSA|nr:hypothetical protein D8674_021799 [Pyrus ussuriensis x Pyrus communis]